MKKLLATLMVLLGVNAWSADVVVTNIAGLPAVDASAQPNDLFMFYDVDNPGARTRKLTVQQLGDTLLNLDIISRGVAVAPGSNTTVGTNKVGWTTVYTVNSTGGGSATNAIAIDDGTGTNTTLVSPTVFGLTSQQLTNRALFIGAGDSEQALFYASSSTATMSPWNFPAWFPYMPTYSGLYDYIPMAVPGQTLVAISNNLESIYVPIAMSSTNRVRYFFIQGGYNDKSGGATDAQVSNTVYGISQLMRSVGCETVVFDIVGYHTAANSLSNLVVDGGADYFIPFAGAESYLMADNIHLLPVGSKLWAQSLTNTIQLAASPELARINDQSTTNVTSEIPAQRFSFNSAYWMPGAGSTGITNIRPYIEWHSDGIVAISTVERIFSGWREFYGKSFASPAAYFGLGRETNGYPLAINLPGTNQVVVRLNQTGSGFYVAAHSGLVGQGNAGFGVDYQGNSFFRGRPTFYDRLNFTDINSNIVGQILRGTNGNALATTDSSWGYKLYGTTNNFFIESDDGLKGMTVAGDTGDITAVGSRFVGDGSGLTNLSSSAIATNPPTDGYVLSATGSDRKWVPVGTFTDGSSLTNLKHGNTASAGWGTAIIATANPDGSTNFQVVATNALTLIATNASAIAVDFTSGTPRYRMDQIHASLAVNPTNIVDGREIALRIHNTSGATRTVTINTNGWNGSIFWNAFPARSGNVVNLTNNSVLDISFLPSNGAMLPVGGLLQ